MWKDIPLVQPLVLFELPVSVEHCCVESIYHELLALVQLRVSVEHCCVESFTSYIAYFCLLIYVSVEHCCVESDSLDADEQGEQGGVSGRKA